MKSGWKCIQLGDCSHIILGGTPKTRQPTYWGGDIPWVSVADFSAEKKIYTTEKTITEKGLNESNTKLLKIGDIIISARGTVGKTVVCGVPMAFNQSCYALNSKSKDLYQDFLYYLINYYVVQLQKKATGGVFDTIVTDTLKSLEIQLPPLPIQRKIASILSAYDDLMENNNRRIKILEEMAQNIYKEWFVNFCFPGHEKVKMLDSPLGKIPEGWEVKSIGDLCTVVPGFAFKSKDWQKKGVPVIKIKNILDSNTVNIEGADYVSNEIITPKLNKYILKNGDFLIAMTGATAGKVGRLRTDKIIFLNQRVAKIMPDNNFHKEYIWNVIISDDYHKRFYNLADGAAQPNMSNSQIENVKLLLPPKILCEKFEKLSDNIAMMIDNLFFRNNILRKSCDLLLPKLISGEIDVERIHA